MREAGREKRERWREEGRVRKSGKPDLLEKISTAISGEYLSADELSEWAPHLQQYIYTLLFIPTNRWSAALCRPFSEPSIYAAQLAQTVKCTLLYHFNSIKSTSMRSKLDRKQSVIWLSQAYKGLGELNTLKAIYQRHMYISSTATAAPPTFHER